MSKRISRLDDQVSKFVRACAVISSFRSVVEELILNSVDAEASAIEIFVDVSRANVTISDDGQGIPFKSLNKNVCEWNQTTNISTNSSAYGFKGETFAALQMISKLEILTKTKHEQQGHMKSFITDSMTTIKFPLKSGTIIKLTDLFYNVPVRRKTMRTNIELMKIKYFIKNISILHHNVSFTLFDQPTNKVLLKLIPDVSVAARISTLHTSTLLCKMKEVRHQVDSYEIAGLISFPNESCCHWTRELQYSYINNRCVQMGDMLSSTIETVYVGLFSSNKSRGPLARHFTATSTQTALYPCFVLQLSCPTTEVDIVSDGDKKCVIFKKPDEVRSLIVSLLRQLIRENCVELLPQFDAIATQWASDIDNYTQRLSRSSRNRNKRKATLDMDESEDQDHDHDQESPRGVTSPPPSATTTTNTDAVSTRRKRRTTSPNNTNTNNLTSSPLFVPFGVRQELFDSANGSGSGSGIGPSPPVNEHGDEVYKDSPNTAFRSAFFSSSSENTPSTATATDAASTTVGMTGNGRDESDDHSLLLLPSVLSLEKEFGVTVLRERNVLEEVYDQMLGSPASRRISHPTNEQNYDYDYNNDNDNDNDNLQLNDPFAFRGIQPTLFPNSNEDVTTAFNQPQRQHERCFEEFSYEESYDNDNGSDGDDNNNDNDNTMISVTKTLSELPSSSSSSSIVVAELPITPSQRSSSTSSRSPGRVVAAAAVRASGRYVVADRNRNGHNDGDDDDDNNNEVRRRTKSVDGSLGMNSTSSTATATTAVSIAIDIDAEKVNDNNDNVKSTNDNEDPSVVRIEKEAVAAATAVVVDESSSFSSSYDSSVLRNQLDSIARRSASSGLFNSLSLTKTMLTNCRVLSQVNACYVLSCTNDSILCCTDQHAADERVQLELLQSTFQSNITTATVTSEQSAEISSHELFILEQYHSLFTEYGFQYDIIPSSFSSSSSSNESSYEAKITLKRNPIILDESLHIGDLLEFVHYVSNNSNTPKNLLKPPSVHRILASRACRYSTHFGDILSTQECNQLLKSLALTKLPFQCAHGRPSVIPLIDIEKYRIKRGVTTKSRQYRKPQYKNLFK